MTDNEVVGNSCAVHQEGEHISGIQEYICEALILFWLILMHLLVIYIPKTMKILLVQFIFLVDRPFK